jgi:hypothetical protein
MGNAFRLPVVRLSASGRLRGRAFHFSPQQRKAAGAELSHAILHPLEADDCLPGSSSYGMSSLPSVSDSSEGDACSAPVIPAKLETPAEEIVPEEGTGNANVSQRFKRSGVFVFKPFVYTEDLEPTPDWDKSIPPAAGTSAVAEIAVSPSMSVKVPEYVPYGIADTSRRGLWLTLGLGSTLVLMAAIAGGYVWYRDAKPAADGPVSSLADLSAKANESVKVAFSGFLTAEDAQSLADRVINGEKKLPTIERYLEKNGSFPKPGELDEISFLPLAPGDSKKGIAGLIYRRDSPVDLLPTNSMPLAVQTAGPLERLAMVSSLHEKKPRRALALFKRKDDQMLLEWDLFVQTWDRSLAAFRDGELGNGPMRLRVLVASDIPVFENGETLESAVFRMQDPLHTEDVIRVQTQCFSHEERRLLEFDRTSPGISARLGKARTATLDLVRDPETGRIDIARFVCWEFLGLGGVEQPAAPEE